MFDLRGKVAVLTGATMWLGRDMAEIFAENGAGQGFAAFFTEHRISSLLVMDGNIIS